MSISHVISDPVTISVRLLLTANRLWLISAPSIRLCLSGSLVSDALSLPAKSTNHILQAKHARTQAQTHMHTHTN